MEGKARHEQGRVVSVSAKRESCCLVREEQAEKLVGQSLKRLGAKR